MKIKNTILKSTRSNTKISVSKIFDATKRLCPQLIIDADIVINTIANGEVIEIISTDSATKSCVPDWCQDTGHILLDSRFNKKDYKYRYLVQRVKKYFLIYMPILIVLKVPFLPSRYYGASQDS